MKRFLLVISFISAICLSVVFQPSFALAQTETTVVEEQVTEVRVSPIWRGVQIVTFVMLLVCLFGAIYGIQQWRSGTNNNDLLVTERGRRLTIIFGLLFFFFLLLFLIAFVVVRRQQRAITQAPTQTVPVGTGGFATNDVLLLVDSQPLGDIPIRNVKVNLFFNQDIAQTAVESFITVENVETGESVVGQWNVTGAIAQFEPNQSCPPPNNDLRCFEENTIYELIITNDLTSLDGDAFKCSVPSEQCSFRFGTGDLIDAEAPLVEMTLPFDGDAVSVDSSTILEALATDDTGLAYIEFSVDGSVQGYASASSEKLLQEFRGSTNWSTEGIQIDSEHTVVATAYDIAGLESVSEPIQVEVLPLHCFDQIQNFDESNIDCGGSECRACNGLACTDNSQCSSGLCFDGQCRAFPILEDAIDDNGAIGNIITLRGKNFGTEPGKVIFLGSAGSDDDVQASFPECASTWQNNQVVIEIPEGAVTGPIRIETAEGLFDLSDDSKGTVFTIQVNDLVRPGLCGVTPSTQFAGSTIQLDGKNFGSEQGDVLIGQFIADAIEGWSNTFIREARIPNIEPGVVSVRVQVGEQVSNPVLLTVQPSPSLPFLERVTPDRGPVGQIFSVIGENLIGTVVVKFRDPQSGEETLASTDLPRSCQNFVSPTQRAIRVPRLEPGVYQVFAETDAGESNTVDFTVNNAQRLPGLCALVPDNGPVGTEVTLHGEGFGSQTGTIRFNPRIDDPQIVSWSDASVAALVPAATSSGPVQVVNQGGVLSNSLDFTVGQCSPDSCETGFECCGNGACQPMGTCVNVVPLCTYSWTFGTGAGLGGPPRVIEDPTCKGNTQSPSAYKGSTDACVNAGISARFTHDMADETLNRDSIIVRKCNAGPVFDQGSCQTSIQITNLTIINANQPGEGFVAYPSTKLDADTWYQVELTTDITAINSLPLQQAYRWQFKSQQGDVDCTVDHVEVTPGAATIRNLGDQQQFTGVPTALNCNVLNAYDYEWRWLSENSGKATVVPTTEPVTQARAVSPTEQDAPVKIFGAIPQFNQEDFGLLTVSLEPPEVVSKWPNCQTACKNAVVGAKFSQDMQESSLTRQGNIRLLKCEDALCAKGKMSDTGIASLEYNAVDFEVYFLPSTRVLETGSYYRVILSDLRAKTGLVLAGLNFDASGDGALDSHSWVFKVKDENEPCTIDSVQVLPRIVDSYLIGQEFDYFSFPVAAPDTCASGGQLLNPYSFDWSWASANEQVGVVTSIDSIDPTGLIDPQQVTTTTGQGETSIIAGAEAKEGAGTLQVTCGFQEDSQCPSPATVETHGVGTDSCCHARPAIVASVPQDGTSAVCTTLSVEVKFNQPLNQESVLTNTFLEYNNGTEACPGAAISEDENTTAWWGGVQRLASAVWEWVIPSTEAQSENWCQVDAGVTIYNDLDSSSVYVTPAVELLQNQQYRVRFVGDTNLTDGVSEGIRSFVNIPYQGERIITFFTGEAKCNLDLVQIEITPPGELGVNDAFFCAGRNDCKGDVNPAAEGNQHSYRATGRDRRGFVIPSDFTWRKGGEDIISLNVNEGEVVEVTPGAENGKARLTVYAKAKGPSTGEVSRTIRLRVFLCENPWPSLLDFPYVDDVFNFDLFYCRDFGEPGTFDDLPPLSDPIIDSNFGGVLQESIFIIEE